MAGTPTSWDDGGAFTSSAGPSDPVHDFRHGRRMTKREFGVYAARRAHARPRPRPLFRAPPKPDDDSRNSSAPTSENSWIGTQQRHPQLHHQQPRHSSVRDVEIYDDPFYDPELEQWAPPLTLSNSAPQLPRTLPHSPITPISPRWDSLAATNRFFPSPPSTPSTPSTTATAEASALSSSPDAPATISPRPGPADSSVAPGPSSPFASRFPGLSSHPFLPPEPQPPSAPGASPSLPKAGRAMVKNFSRPRRASVKQQTPPRQDEQQPIENGELANSEAFTDDSCIRSNTSSIYSNRNMAFPGGTTTPSPATTADSRARAQSLSSAKSSSTFASLPHRPSHDHLAGSSNRSLASTAATNTPRHLALSNTSRPLLSYASANAHAMHAHPREGLPWMASDDELRSSYRSQLSASTAQATLFTATGTERSSVLTKTSSISGSRMSSGEDGFAGDEGLSVEDVMGLYEKGFEDDDSSTADADFDSGSPEPAVGGDSAIADPPSGFSTVGDGPSKRRLGADANRIELPRDLPETSQQRDAAESFVDSPSRFPLPAPPTAAGGLPGPSISSPSLPVSSPPQTISRPSQPSSHSRETAEDPASRDRYGFRKTNAYITRAQYDAWDAGYSEYLARRRRKWVAYLREQSLMTDQPNRFPQRSAKTKRFVRKGIPPDWRGAAWFYYAGGPALLAKNAGVYDDLVRRAGLATRDGERAGGQGEVKEVDVEVIERDLHRTFPDNLRFKPVPLRTSTGPGRDAVNGGGDQHDPTRPDQETAIISSLRRVLHAFALYNPRIGYCQSLNFLAGLLLLFVETEEQAFWLLNVLTRIHLPGTHEVSLEGSKVDLGVLMAELKEHLPGVWARIASDEVGGGGPSATSNKKGPLRRPRLPGKKNTNSSNGPEDPSGLPPITLCMTPWFMSCFIGTLPLESTLRVWDIFFYEGARTLFRVAMAIFKLGEADIRAVQDPMEMFAVVQTLPRRMLDTNALMEATFKRRNGFKHLSQEALDSRRAERRADIRRWKAEMAKRNRKDNDTSGDGQADDTSGPRTSQLAMGLDLAADLTDVEAAGGSLRRKGTLFGRRKDRYRERPRILPAEV